MNGKVARLTQEELDAEVWASPCTSPVRTTRAEPTSRWSFSATARTPAPCGMGRFSGTRSRRGAGSLSHAGPYVLSESQYQFVFSQSGERSILAARRSLQLPPEAHLVLPALSPGRCLARRAQGPWTYPVEIQADYIPSPRGLPPPSYDSLPFIPGQSLDRLPEVQAAPDDQISNRRRAGLTPPTGASRRARLARAGLPKATALRPYGGPADVNSQCHSPRRPICRPHLV